MWVFSKIGVFTPQIIHFNRVFHYKPSILGIFGIPLFLETSIFFVFVESLLLNRPVAKVTGHRTHLNQIFHAEAAPGIFQVTAPWSTTKGKKPPLIKLGTCVKNLFHRWKRPWELLPVFGKFHFGNSMFDTLLI